MVSKLAGAIVHLLKSLLLIVAPLPRKLHGSVVVAEEAEQEKEREEEAEAVEWKSLEQREKERKSRIRRPIQTRSQRHRLTPSNFHGLSK
mmetsp:Transcript_112746/g.217142  ORF Transcript_112746/g.217142 Transcript_112746/m.217142 type:complete len:90 (-) Transcript_112746:121-390(-)